MEASGRQGKAVPLSLRVRLPTTPFAEGACPLCTYTVSVFPVSHEALRGLPSLFRCAQRVHLGASPCTRSAARLPPSSHAVASPHRHLLYHACATLFAALSLSL